MATLSAGILAGPVGSNFISTGNLPAFFEKVRLWHGNKSDELAPIGMRRGVLAADPQVESLYDLKQSRPTQHVAFNVFVRYSNEQGDAFPDIPEVNSVGTPNVSRFSGIAQRERATIFGPVGQSASQFLPLDSRCHIRFSLQVHPMPTRLPARFALSRN